jgi:hypothetical protein
MRRHRRGPLIRVIIGIARGGYPHSVTEGRALASLVYSCDSLLDQVWRKCACDRACAQLVEARPDSLQLNSVMSTTVIAIIVGLMCTGIDKGLVFVPRQ